MAKSKVSPVMENAVAVVPETTNTAVVEFGDAGDFNFEGVTPEMLGAPPFIKVERGPKAGKLAGAITFDGDSVILPDGEKTSMIIESNKPVTAVSYQMEQNDEGGWAPRKWDTMADALADGETDKWIDGKGPTAVPCMELKVLVETDSPVANIDFDGRKWVRGVMSCSKRDFDVVTNFVKKWASAAKVEGRKMWMLEWELSTTLADKHGNCYLTTALKQVHTPDSAFSEEYSSTVG